MVFRVVSDPPVILNRPNESLETVSPITEVLPLENIAVLLS